MYKLKIQLCDFMCTVGFVTNGEWNSLRAKGDTRPLSVFEIQTEVRRKYSRLSASTLVKLITPTGVTYMINTSLSHICIFFCCKKYMYILY